MKRARAIPPGPKGQYVFHELAASRNLNGTQDYEVSQARPEEKAKFARAREPFVDFRRSSDGRRSLGVKEYPGH